MCLTCKSTVMVVTNHSSISKVANTKSLHFEYVAHILLFAIFFHLRFIFSQNILHETYIQQHKRPIFFLSNRGWNALFLTICFIQISKNVSYNCYIPPNKQTFTSTWNNCAELSKRLCRSRSIQKIHHCLYSDNLLLLRKILQKNMFATQNVLLNLKKLFIKLTKKMAFCLIYSKKIAICRSKDGFFGFHRSKYNISKFCLIN